MSERGQRRTSSLGIVLCWALGLGGPGCKGSEFFPLPSEVDQGYVALLQRGPDGETRAATPIRPVAEALNAELAEDPEAQTFVYVFAPERFAELHEVAGLAGLDASRLQAEEPVRLAAGCAPTYPSADRLYTLDLDRIVPLDPSLHAPELTAAWLLDTCAPVLDSAPGFVSSIVINSTCDACPARQIETVGACGFRLRTGPNLCTGVTDDLSLRRDWRGDFCLESSSTCEPSARNQLRCEVGTASCELELHVEAWTEADRFAVSEPIREASFNPTDDLVGVASLSIGERFAQLAVNPRSFRQGRCLNRESTRMELFSVATATLARAFDVPGCVLASSEGANGESIVVVTVSAEEEFDLVELGLNGQELARTRLDPQAALGLSTRREVGVDRLLRWPEQEGWVAGFSEVSDTTRPGVLAFFQGVGPAAAVNFGPRFTVPEGGYPTRVLETGPDGPGLYLVSGGNWAHLRQPGAEVVFRALGAFNNQFPTPRDVGVTQNGRAWISGAQGQSAALVPFEPETRTRALLGEVSGDARLMTAWSAEHELVVTVSAEGVFATRFDAVRWRFVPGTLTVSASSQLGAATLLGALPAPDGTVWVIYRDGRLRRIKKP